MMTTRALDTPGVRIAAWLDGHGPEPERAEILSLLDIAANEPACPLQHNWPIFRIARLDPPGELRRHELTGLWCMVWLAVINAQARELLALDEQEVDDMVARIEALPPRLRGIFLTVLRCYELGGTLAQLTELAQLLLSAESGSPS